MSMKNNNAYKTIPSNRDSGLVLFKLIITYFNNYILISLRAINNIPYYSYDWLIIIFVIIISKRHGKKLIFRILILLSDTWTSFDLIPMDKSLINHYKVIKGNY